MRESRLCIYYRKEIKMQAYMADEKLELLLNAALAATPREREKSEILNVGFDTETKIWEVIVKYHGDLLFWKSFP